MLSPNEHRHSRRKRHVRKSHRRVKNSFLPLPSQFYRWCWYDCAFGCLTLILIVYSFFAIVYSGRYIRSYRVRATQTKGRNFTITSNVVRNYNYVVATPFAASLLVIGIYLFILMICVFIWLRYLRNVGYFVILAIGIIFGSLYFLTLGAVAIKKSSNRHEMKKIAFTVVSKQLEEMGESLLLEERIKIFSEKNQCCGMRSFRDWETWNKITVWNVAVNLDSIPNECCRNHTEGTEVNAVQDECQNTDVLKEKDNSARLKKINTLPCGDVIWKEVRREAELRQYICHGFIIGVILLIFLLLFILLFRHLMSIWRERKKSGNGGSFDDPLEQENLVESEIIPGTPAKSMLSDSENTFYAP